MVKIFMLMFALLTLSVACSRNPEYRDSESGTGSAAEERTERVHEGQIRETGSSGK